MGVIGGTFGIRLLNYASKNGTVGYPDVATAYIGTSKLQVLLGPGIWEELRGKDVIDFGCGTGHEAVEVAQRGARRVVGVDKQPRWLEIARRRASEAGVSDRCTFATAADFRADVILSLDSFEHFEDPSAILRAMHGLIKPDGVVLVSFGPTWYHPYGGHIYSVFPYAHLLFTESALVRWRSLYKVDGAQSIAQSGLNQITVKTFERYVEASPLRFEDFEAVPIRRLAPLANRFTREFTTAVVRCRLVPR